MFDFPITPRESFLIGICVGEYMESRKTNQSCTFMSVIERRFAPFFPTFPNAPDRKEIESWMIPEETEWIEPSPGMEFGYAESCPSTLFVRSGSHLERLLWKPTTRRSLIELLLLRLSPSVSFSVGDRFNFPVTDRVDRAKAFFDLFRCVKHPESAFERSSRNGLFHGFAREFPKPETAISLNWGTISAN